MRQLELHPGSAGLGVLSGRFLWYGDTGPKAFGPGLFCWTISWSTTGISPKNCALEHDSLVNPTPNPEEPSKRMPKWLMQKEPQNRLPNLLPIRIAD
jgi:hypothetical protein